MDCVAARFERFACASLADYFKSVSILLAIADVLGSLEDRINGLRNQFVLQALGAGLAKALAQVDDDDRPFGPSIHSPSLAVDNGDIYYGRQDRVANVIEKLSTSVV